jgi:hypothetical protein
LNSLQAKSSARDLLLATIAAHLHALVGINGFSHRHSTALR